MVRHKAPTSVTIAPTRDEASLQAMLAKYWMYLALAVGVIVLWVLASHYLSQKRERDQVASWKVLLDETTLQGFPRVPMAPPATLERLAKELEGTPAGPWTRVLEANAHVQEGQYEAAKKAIEALQREYPNHPLVSEVYGLGPGGTPRSIADHFRQSIERYEGWEKSHPELFENPPLAEAPRVRLRTDRGDIVVGVYMDEAPEHAANFLELCRQGYYDGTKFHRVVPGFMIQGGDPNTRDGDPSTWGQGGPEETIPPEQNDLRHFAGVLSAAKKPGEINSSGSQFFITTNPAHHLDGMHVVFGQVLEGMDIVRQIANSPLEPGQTDRPANPAVIQSAEVL